MSSTAPESESTPAEELDSHILVAYFSRMGNLDFDENVDAITSASANQIDGEYVGNAQLLAQMAQDAIGGDLFAIETIEKYPAGYRDTTNLANDEKSEDTRPELIADVIKEVDGTIMECNTAYSGSRSETAMHYQVAEVHGFTTIADFQIQDEDGSMTLPVKVGTVLTENYVGVAFADYDNYPVLSHFKGHSMAGFGGAIKNISIDCDCDGNSAEPDIHDIGILASTDSVAIDQASIDLTFAAEEKIHDAVKGLTDKKLGAFGVVPASILGIASPLCMYGTIPLAASFSRYGLSVVNLA